MRRRHPGPAAAPPPVPRGRLDRFRTQTGGLVFLVEGWGPCGACGRLFPGPLVIATTSGYSNQGGAVIGMEAAEPRCPGCRKGA